MKHIIFSLLTLLLCSQFVPATIIHVPNEQPTIQEGINVSNNGDTVLVADGMYSGTGNFNLDFGGRAISVMSANGPETCMIMCGANGRGAYFHSGETSAAILKGFAIVTGSSVNGGGLNITNSSPTIERCIITNNISPNSYGGGIYISNGSPSILLCTIAANSSKYGGAIYSIGSSPVINSCIVVNNSASG